MKTLYKKKRMRKKRRRGNEEEEEIHGNEDKRESQEKNAENVVEKLAVKNVSIIIVNQDDVQLKPLHQQLVSGYKTERCNDEHSTCDHIPEWRRQDGLMEPDSHKELEIFTQVSFSKVSF